MSVGGGASETGRRRRRLAPALTVVTVAGLVVAGVLVAPRVRDGIAAGRIVSWLDGEAELAAIDVGVLERRPGVWRALATRVRGRPDALCLPERRVFVGLREQALLVATEEEGELHRFAGNPAEWVWCAGESWRLQSVRLDIEDQPEVVLADGTIWGSSIVMRLPRKPQWVRSISFMRRNPRLLKQVQ